MSLEQKLDNLRIEIHNTLVERIVKHGVKSKSYSFKVLIPSEDRMFNIDGTSTYIVEVSLHNLVGENGYLYSHDCISDEQLCQIIDEYEEI